MKPAARCFRFILEAAAAEYENVLPADRQCMLAAFEPIKGIHMKILAEFDSGNYEPDWKVVSRNAVRAVIIRDGKIALVKSEKEGYYKFPGGGIEQGESHAETLIRETLEETGLCIKPDSIREFGMIIEKRKSLYSDAEIFEQKSYYYFAEAERSVLPQRLEKYETELGFGLEWTDIKYACRINLGLAKGRNASLVLRESYVLGLL